MTITNDIPLEHLHTPAGGGLASFPPPDEWDDWVDYGPNDLPDVEGRHYALVPTVCFNCEAACGLLAYVDKESHEIHKIEGHPLHPGSRGRNCPKGPATLNQVNNPDRILKPLRRVGERGEGQWQEVTWDEALDDIAGRIRAAIKEDRRDEVVYHVGRSGEDGYTERVIAAWGVDGHNSHTNVCSSSARAGYSFWMGMDRPNPDYEHAKFILLMSSHLESGHYFNPHAQRIIDAKLRGTKVAVVDTRLSNTASQADIWLSPSPGTEAAMLLAMANHLIQNDLFDAEFVRRWVNWQDLLEDWNYLDFLKEDGAIEAVPKGESFGDFVELLKQMYWEYTPEWAEEESGVPAEAIVAVADEIARAGTAFASHIWRNAAAGHLGGWMITRCLFFLNVLTGSVATKGGTIPNGWTKFVPKPHTIPSPIKTWNENHWPLEFPLAHFEMSFLLPHILKDNGKSIDVYFTRVYNPVWTNPDGTAWVEMLEDDRIGLHVALTPVWSETAQWADYVLPTGLGPERHDLHSLETHASQWIGWRQPVIRALKEKLGHDVTDTRDANPGDVWEENEFWIELSWRIDPDGSMGIRRHFESPFRPGEKIGVNDYYRYIFENGVPGLPEKAAEEGLTPFEYMRKYAAFEVTTDVYDEHECPVDESILNDPLIIDEDTGLIWCAQPGGDANNRPYPGPFRDESGKIRIGIEMDGRRLMGFPTPSARLEFYSPTLKEWGWPQYAVPRYPRNEVERERMEHIVSQVHPTKLDYDANEYDLLPTFRLPNLIHSRTNGAKWLHEIAHTNPVWVNPIDARRMSVETGDLVKVETEIGSFVDRVWVTESIRPGVVACSHHMGRWRRFEEHGSDRWNSAVVDLSKDGDEWNMRQRQGVTTWKSSDPDSERLWWSDGGVHQNLIMPVQPDPISGQHCWHQKVRVTKAGPDDKYGDVKVDSEKAHQVYKRWLKLCRPAPGPDGTRRPYWLLRPIKPAPEAFRV